jgi:membrane associated rhomboid family serine protease
VIPFLVLLYRSRRPLVNITLITVNIAAFLYGLSLSGFDQRVFFLKWGLIPAELTSGKELPLLVVTNAASPITPWGTVFTSMFIHGSILHIVGNMLFLWGFGGKVEEKLGHIKYLLFYAAAGVAAVWTQVAVDLDSRTPLIGASGAISGVVAAYMLSYPYPNAIWLLAIFFILPLFFSVGSVIPGTSGTQIAYMAHLGGLVAGALMVSGYKMALRQPILPPFRWRPGGSWR